MRDDSGERASAVAAQVLPELRGWVDANVNPEHGCAEIVRPSDGARVRIRVEPWHYEGRVVFEGVWPSFADGRYHFHADTIRVTCDLREPESFAKAISGRLLRSYGPAYKEARAYVQRDNERAAEARLVAGHIAHAIGGTVRPDAWQRKVGEVGIDAGSESVGQLVVRKGYGSEHGGQEVRVCFEVHNLAPEVAARVLEVIREAERAPEVAKVRVDPPVEETEEEETPSLTRRVGTLTI